jgi:hypothetical protein
LYGTALNPAAAPGANRTYARNGFVQQKMALDCGLSFEAAQTLLCAPQNGGSRLLSQAGRILCLAAPPARLGLVRESDCGGAAYSFVIAVAQEVSPSGVQQRQFIDVSNGSEITKSG